MKPKTGENERKKNPEPFNIQNTSASNAFGTARAYGALTTPSRTRFSFVFRTDLGVIEFSENDTIMSRWLGFWKISRASADASPPFHLVSPVCVTPTCFPFGDGSRLDVSRTYATRGRVFSLASHNVKNAYRRVSKSVVRVKSMSFDYSRFL